MENQQPPLKKIYKAEKKWSLRVKFFSSAATYGPLGRNGRRDHSYGRNHCCSTAIGNTSTEHLFVTGENENHEANFYNFII